MKLFYREMGEGSPLVILHGVFGSSDNLLTAAKLLSDTYKVYLPDARNHGHSPHSEIFTYEAMAEDLREFLIEHAIKNPVIIGHSMGGKTVMKFASKHENMARKFIIMDIGPRYYSRHHDQILDGLNAIDLKHIASRQDADKQLATFIPEPAVRQFLLKNLDRSDSGFKWRLNLPVITDKIENIGEGLNENVRITKPTLFIKGSESNYIQEKDLPLIRRIFTNLTLETLKGTGHWLHAEKPLELTKIVREFIKVS